MLWCHQGCHNRGHRPACPLLTPCGSAILSRRNGLPGQACGPRPVRTDSLCPLCGINPSLASLCGYAQDGGGGGGGVILVKASIKEKKGLSDNIKYSSFRPLGAVRLGSRVTPGPDFPHRLCPLRAAVISQMLTVISERLFLRLSVDLRLG